MIQFGLHFTVNLPSQKQACRKPKHNDFISSFGNLVIFFKEPRDLNEMENNYRVLNLYKRTLGRKFEKITKKLLEIIQGIKRSIYVEFRR